MSNFDKALDMYYEKFGKNYPISITGELDEDEMLEEIRECILNDKPAEDLNLDDGENY